MPAHTGGRDKGKGRAAGGYPAATTLVSMCNMCSTTGAGTPRLAVGHGLS